MRDPALRALVVGGPVLSPACGGSPAPADVASVADAVLAQVREEHAEAVLYVHVQEGALLAPAVERGRAEEPPRDGVRCPWSRLREEGDTTRAGVRVDVSAVELGRREARLRVDLSGHTVRERPRRHRRGFASRTAYVLEKEGAAWRVVSTRLVLIS